MYSIKNRENLENLNELITLQSLVKALELQYKVEKQNFQEDMKKIFEPSTKTVKDTSQDITKTTTATSKKKNKALLNLREKLLKK